MSLIQIGEHDVWAALAALMASAFFGLRAQALKPLLRGYPDGPGDVRWAIFAMSVACGAYAVTVIDGYESTRTECVIFTVVALYAFVLWRNIRRQVSAAEVG